MNAFVAVTDREWFEQLRLAGALDEVNFWPAKRGGIIPRIGPGRALSLQAPQP